MDRGQEPRHAVGTDHEDAGYRLVAEQVRRHFGLDLACYRYDQLHRRLLGFARRRHIDSLTQYAQLLSEDAQEREGFVHRFSINVSEFFRDPDRFDILEREVLPDLLADRARLRVWSAGCSGGHEPFSLAMLLADRNDESSHHILATDIDSVALTQARNAGPYAEKQIRNVRPDRRHRYLRAQDAGHWRVTDELRSAVRFQRHDLLQDDMPVGFDLIVCRNVLIYFTPHTRARIFARFAEALRPGGVLFVGATEALSIHQAVEIRPQLQPVRFGFYVREDQRARA